MRSNGVLFIEKLSITNHQETTSSTTNPTSYSNWELSNSQNTYKTTNNGSCWISQQRKR